MRRTYISPEFDYKRVNGTFNMKEESSFFGSKMLEIEDSISISNQSLVYFQSLSKEQLDLNIESSLSPISYSSSEDKQANHSLIFDDSQSISQKNSMTKYLLSIDLKSILSNYIFATLKRYRTFEGVKNNMTKNGDVDFAIKEYIDKNILDRYKLDKIELFINYVNIKDQSILKYNNIWSGYTDPVTLRSAISTSEILNDKYKLNKFESKTEFDYSSTIIQFTQEKNSSEYCFDYFFKLLYQKI